MGAHDSNLNELDPESGLKNVEKNVSTVPLTTNEEADQRRVELQKERSRCKTRGSAREKKEKYSYAVPDGSPSIFPQITNMVKG